MTDRRDKKRGGSDRRHPLSRTAKLSPRSSSRQLNPAKERLTVSISADVVERLRNAVYWTEGATIAIIDRDNIDRAERSVDAMEEARGKTFSRRSSPLRVGRPPK